MAPELNHLVRLRKLAQFLILPAVIPVEVAPSDFAQRIELTEGLGKGVLAGANVILCASTRVRFDTLPGLGVGLSVMSDLRSSHEFVHRGSADG